MINASKTRRHMYRAFERVDVHGEHLQTNVLWIAATVNCRSLQVAQWLDYLVYITTDKFVNYLPHPLSPATCE